MTELRRADRDFISWPVKGLRTGLTAEVELNGSGDWEPLEVEVASKEVTGYFAGPGFTSPGIAIVVPQTSFCLLRFSDGTISVTKPGGFIELIP